MILTIQTRSGRELVPGGVRVDEQVLVIPLTHIESIYSSLVLYSVRMPVTQVRCATTLQASVDTLKATISKSHPKLYSSRQRLTLPPQPGQRSGTALVDGKPLKEYGLSDGSTVFFKDLGTQVCQIDLRICFTLTYRCH